MHMKSFIPPLPVQRITYVENWLDWEGMGTRVKIIHKLSHDTEEICMRQQRTVSKILQ